MSLPILISSSTFQAVTATQLRDYLRIDDGETDITLDFYIKTATEYLEIASKRTIIRKRYMLSLDYTCHRKIYLPMGHVASIVLIEIDGQIVDVNDFILKNDTLNFSVGNHQTVSITYDVGYENPQDIPHRYQLAILACAADLYIYRHSNQDGSFRKPSQLAEYYSTMFKTINI